MAKKQSGRHSADPILLLAVIGLVLFGLIVITSASAVIAERFRSDTFFFFKHQLLFGVLITPGNRVFL